TFEENTKIFENTRKVNGFENHITNALRLTPFKVLTVAASHGIPGLDLMRKTPFIQNAIYTKNAFDTIMDLAGKGTGSSRFQIFGKR
ncbi:hypothetical protein KGM_213763B, partial [Danaus plexippus plexippus]